MNIGLITEQVIVDKDNFKNVHLMEDIIVGRNCKDFEFPKMPYLKKAYFHQVPNKNTNLILDAPNLTHLEVGIYYIEPLDLPNKLTHLSLGYYYNEHLNLPTSLTHLNFQHHYRRPISLSPNITHLRLSVKYNHPTFFPNSITHLKLGAEYNQPTVFPFWLTHLILGGYSPTELPSTITHLTMGPNFDRTIPLPNLVQLYCAEGLNNSKRCDYESDNFR